jgi:hypothetical protein
LSPAEIYRQAKMEIEVNGLTGTPCPFQLGPACNKKGGVCSLRQYKQVGDGPVSGVGPIITTCPQRFLEASTIFRWVGEVLLETTEPIVLSQIGFLDRLRTDPTPEEEEEAEDTRDFIGRTDNVLVHPTRNSVDWCALEIQAVCFSGKSMRNEFTILAATELETLAYPAKHRRPDWRSSGPKRLLPQFQTKVPTIATWGKKVAVVIDEALVTAN